MKWKCGLFSNIYNGCYNIIGCTPLLSEENVIEYEGNEHLLGTCITPEYKWGDKIEVNLNGVWEPALYKCKSPVMPGYHHMYLGEGVSTFSGDKIRYKRD